MTRVPWASCMPSGSVTRRIFLATPSGSMMHGGNDRLPDSMRASLPVKQTCLAFGRRGALEAELGPGRKISCACCCWLALPAAQPGRAAAAGAGPRARRAGPAVGGGRPRPVRQPLRLRLLGLARAGRGRSALLGQRRGLADSAKAKVSASLRRWQRASGSPASPAPTRYDRS